MKKIDFLKLYELDYNLSNIFAVNQFWKENTNFKMTAPRRTSALLYFCGCSAKYSFNDQEELTVPKGTIIYIPEGSVYTTTFLECDTEIPSTILIEFSLSLSDTEHFCAAEKPFVLRQEGNMYINDLFYEAVENYSLAVIPLSKVKSVVYQLLSTLSYAERQQSINSRGFNTIAQGIAHLENDLKSKKTIKEIAEMCHVSESTFRRLFKQYTGKSPVEYRIERRIEYAKKLLNTKTLTALEVSLETGFDDPAYFCRMFKKYTGVTTGEYIHEIEYNDI